MSCLNVYFSRTEAFHDLAGKGDLSGVKEVEMEGGGALANKLPNVTAGLQRNVQQ